MEYREKGNQSKGFELKRLQKEHPDFSPFVLLKLSLIRYGAVLTKRAKKKKSCDRIFNFYRMQPSDYSLEKKKNMSFPVLFF